MKTRRIQLPAPAGDPRREAIPDAVLTCPGSTLFKLKKVLVPIDFSPCSLKALTYAIQFAREFGATLDVVHIVPPYYAADPYGLGELERVEKQLLAAGEQKLAAMVLQQVPQGIPAETFVRRGRPATEIVQIARDQESDLIIIATHGRSGLKHLLMGSTAENVVRHAPCPVLTVREREHDFLA